VQLILLITVLVVWKRLRSSVLGSSEGSWDLPIPRAGERDLPCRRARPGGSALQRRAWKSSRMRRRLAGRGATWPTAFRFMDNQDAVTPRAASEPPMSYCPPEPGGLTATTTPTVRAVDPSGLVIGPFWLVWAITISPYPYSDVEASAAVASPVAEA
jgi:hypothetical protein